MSQVTFNDICNEIGFMINKMETRFRKPVEGRKRVLLTLWKQATNIDYRSIAHLFGIGRSTACTIFHEIVVAINTNLTSRYIRFLQGEALRSVTDGFRTRWGFPQCCGAIDGTHIPIISPHEHHSDYFNRKSFHSIILEAVVNDKYRFININVVQPGKHHNAFVLRNSPIFQSAEERTLLPDSTELFNTIDVPLLLIGVPAYLLKRWLMKAFPNVAGLNERQKKLNYRLSRARMTVECAFGRLKGRWRCLLMRLDCHLCNASAIVTACCTLSTICDVHGNFFNQEWLNQVLAMITNHEIEPSSMQTIYRGR